MMDTSSMTEEEVRELRERIQAAVAEANDPATEWVSHATIKSDADAQRSRILATLANDS